MNCFISKHSAMPKTRLIFYMEEDSSCLIVITSNKSITASYSGVKHAVNICVFAIKHHKCVNHYILLRVLKQWLIKSLKTPVMVRGSGVAPSLADFHFPQNRFGEYF